MPKRACSIEEWVEIILKRIIKKENGCWEYLRRKDGSGYSSIFVGGRKGKNIAVHKLIYEKLIDKIPDNKFILHKCDNPLCCNPEHLFLGTQKDNMSDMLKKGRNFLTIGKKNGNCKLNKDEVEKIRKSKESGIILARKYGVVKSTISMIRNMKSRIYA